MDGSEIKLRSVRRRWNQDESTGSHRIRVRQAYAAAYTQRFHLALGGLRVESSIISSELQTPSELHIFIDRNDQCSNQSGSSRDIFERHTTSALSLYLHAVTFKFIILPLSRLEVLRKFTSRYQSCTVSIQQKCQDHQQSR